jgi:YVTN family beta-propeller protein
MNSVCRISAVLLSVVAGFPTQAAPKAPYLHPPSVEQYARHDPSGTTILSNGRYLTPAGHPYPIHSWPHGLAMTRDGATLFIASAGAGQLVTGWQGPSPQIRDVVPPQKGKKRGENSGGADFSPDGKTLYWSGGDSGTVYVFDVTTGQSTGEIALNAPVNGISESDSFANDVKVSADGKFLYCADVANFRIAVINTTLGKTVGSTRAGRYPYALAVADDTVYAANIGLFEYQPIPDSKDPRFDNRGLTRPPYGYPSKEAIEGVEMEGRHVPGLGADNLPESFSVWGFDVTHPEGIRVSSRLKTGLLIGAPTDNGKAVGGSAPNFVALSGNNLFVSNGNNDLIERIDRARNQLVKSQRLTPSPLTASLRGVSPAGMAVSPDGKRLYVAEMGINAIAVLDAESLTVLGHIPTAWYPYRVAVSPDGGKLACICFRGFGNGPNAGSQIPKSEFLHLRGVLSVLDVPAPATLATLTAQVLTNNGLVDHEADRVAMTSPVIPSVPGKRSAEIKYVVFITKENHTYDTIFDHVPGANDDPSLLRWGYHQTISGKGVPTLTNVAVMKNHNSLARQFTVSDNFYMEPEASGVGHRWLVGVQPNNLMQLNYTVGWHFQKDGHSPGRRYSMGSNGSLIPEDYPEAGSMWDHLARHHVSFRNYGEGFEFPGVDEDPDESPTGAREVVNVPMPKVLFDNTCFEFPIFNMNIPDQYRAHWFRKDVEARFGSGKKKLPSFINIAICNDHGTEPNPDRGYPYLASWMMDNDVALGRIVDYLSHTPWWKNMAIFVTQDDSGGEPDHVDAQRSVLLVISPWARHGYVSHRHTTIVSMHRTMYEILGLPPLNLFDALANDFGDCFTNKPDFTPYVFEPADPRIFDAEKAKDPKDPDYGLARRKRSVPMDDDDEMEAVLRAGARESRPR